MPTTITKTIAATSSPTTPDYTTLAAWIAACPANLVTSDEIWQGNCLDQGEFTGSGVLCNITGITVDSTRYVVLTCASGASFSAKAGVRTTALAYNASNGVAIRRTSNYGPPIQNAIANTQFIGLQVKGPATGNCYAISLTAAVSSQLVDSCILQTAANCATLSLAGGGATHVAKNTLFVGNGANAGIDFAGNISCYGCTFINLSSGTGTALGSGGASTKAIDCAFFGFSANGSATGTGTGNNATDLATAPGSSNQTSLTFSSQVISTTTDFRAASGGALPNHGTTNSNILLDISGTTRSLTTPTIGCWEIVASGGLFRQAPMTGLGTGGPFFSNPIG